LKVAPAPIDVSAIQVRSLALAAQGLASRRPARPAVSHLRGLADRLHALQLDTVNVLVRAHYLPLFSRVGPYPMAALDRLVNVRHELIELDAHQASFVPVRLEPLFRWRGARTSLRSWASARERLRRERPGYIEAVAREVVERGPVTLSDLSDPGRRPKQKASELPFRRRDGKPYAESSVLWGRASDGKAVLDGMLAEGRLALAGRRGFERMYDLHERVVPPEILARPTPAEGDAKRALIGLAAAALGVATLRDLADYFKMTVADARAAVGPLVEEGTLQAARVEGWRDAAFLHTQAKVPGTLEARALLSPFDSLTWTRGRTQRLLGFDFSFEIYVPEAKRKYGYYVLPFLLGGAVVARVDLKADRKRGVLMVPGAFAEAGVDRKPVAEELAAELRVMAGWLGLEGIEVGSRGDLCRVLAAACRERSRRR
jgi:uncharacterized protein